MAGGSTDSRTVLTVIYFLGTTTLVLVGGSMLLVYALVSPGRPIDPTAVAVLSTITGLAGTAVGALASLLVSTRSGQDDSTPVPVTTPEGTPLEVTPVADPTPPPDGDLEPAAPIVDEVPVEAGADGEVPAVVAPRRRRG